MQTKLQSLFETLINIAIGFVISLCANIIILPMFGLKTSFKQDVMITICFTFVSIVRSYFVRRMFNNWHQNKEKIVDFMQCFMLKCLFWVKGSSK